MKYIFIALAFTLPLTATAAESSYTIKQLSLERERVVISFKGELPEGTELIATFKGGKQCPLKVVTAKGGIANLNTSSCKLATDLVVGQKLQKSMAIEEPAAPAPVEQAKTEPKSAEPSTAAKSWPAPDGRIHGSAYLFVDTGSEITFRDLKATTGSTVDSGSAKWDTDAGLGVGVEISQIFSKGLGWNSGLTYDSNRDVNSASVTAAGTTSTANYISPKPHFSFFAIYGNFVYQVKRFYFPVGLNLSIPTFKQGTGATGSVEVTGGVGGQTGAGFRITPHFSVELLVRIISLSVKSEVGPTSYDYGTGTMPGAHSNFKFDY